MLLDGDFCIDHPPGFTNPGFEICLANGLGFQLSIESSPGQGTELQVRIPFADQRQPGSGKPNESRTGARTAASRQQLGLAAPRAKGPDDSSARE